MSNYGLASTTWGAEERLAVEEVLNSGNLTMGRQVKNFESDFANYFESKHAVMVNSGSSANLLAVAALTLKRNKPLTRNMEVIVPTISWATTYYPVHQYGMTLRFVDVSKESLNIDIDLIKKAINQHTGAIFAVNLLGQSCDLGQLRKLADENGIYLIEDNCESMGASVDGKYAGTWGDLGTFSFYFSHHINTIEGGMILTNDDELKDILISIRAHGWTRGLEKNNHVFNKTGDDWDDLFRFVLPGFNVRPMEIQGALGQSQLRKFDSFLQNRRNNHMHFIERFKEMDGVQIQLGPGISSSFGFSIVLNNNLPVKRKHIIDKLNQNGIETRPIVAGNFLSNPVINRMRVVTDENNPVADWVHSSGFFLGNHHFDIREKIDQAYEVISSTILNGKTL